ncbi:TetR/AcrR family transcriptional regulator [Arenibaculum pallidiluteum]|uniref:TetR/AcrR family transcriptional regulator n=1 Tax=Arenibaculum pallidiluteum TaxID=2812559 RepID=UPI001A97BD2B|nr:TetR/AcrR family transcriptional regulator [Arenibaculum pallidiluteum]
MKVAKEEIVVAARELFRERGYAGASMQDLADRVGLRKASLYMRFPNKEALVPEVLDLTLRETLSRPDMDDRPWNVAYEALVRAIAADLSDRKRCVGLHLAYGVGDDTPVAKEAVRAFFQSLRDRLGGILARAMPRERAETVASDALIRLEGATLLTAVFDDTEAMERVVRTVVFDAAEAARRAMRRASDGKPSKSRPTA